ncbi:hypothetical protein BK799_29615 [Rhodococcus sp. D-1]|nr:hypothetical protein BK799_29615 [Rhodococcus sp. D-1]
MCGEEESGVVHEIDGCCGSFVVPGFGVRQAGVTVDRGMQVGVADAGLVVLRFPALGAFGLLGPAAVNAPPAAVGDLPNFLDVDVDHLSWLFRDDDLWFSVGFAVRVDEPATIQPEIPQDLRDRPASNVRSVHSEFERYS